MSDILSVDGVSAAYGDGPRVLRGVSLNLAAGDIVGVLGMNGAGKSTLIRTISGELVPVEGRVTFRGLDTRGKSVAKRVRDGLVTLPEGHRVLQPLTVRENLELATLRLRRREVSRVLDRNLDFIHELFPILKERSSQLAGLLSGGEQQMLSLGRALMAEPRVLLLDEPSLGLAPSIVGRIYEVLPALAERGIAMVVVEQSPLRLQTVCGRIVVLRDGEVTAESRAADLTEEILQNAYFGRTGSNPITR